MDGFGLDRVSVSFPVTTWERDETAWSSLSVRSAGPSMATRSWSASNVGSEGKGIFCGVMDAAGAPGAWGKLEFNPARLCGSHPDPSTPTCLRPALRDAIEAAGDLIQPAVSLDEMRVRRLDVARDFSGVGRPDAYVRGLLTAHRPWARRSFVYHSPDHGQAETLFVGSGAGGCRLYDKHAENPQVERGTVRWEVECRREWLARYAGISEVADVSDDRIRFLARNRWEWSAMGAEVVGGRSMVEKVHRSGMTPQQCRSFIGWLVEQAAGASSSSSTHTEVKYRRLARDLGIAVSAEVWSDAAVVGRLDYDQGAEVLTLVA